MAVLFNITHDANNLNEYDATETDFGDLSTGTPGLAETVAKMEAYIDSIDSMYGRVDFSLSTSDFRIRFYLDPNGVSMDDGETWYPLIVRTPDDPWNLYQVGYLQASGNQELVLVSYEDDSTETWGSQFDIPDEEHYIEVHTERAESAISPTGRNRIWLDGVLKDTHDTLDNYDLWATVHEARFGVAGPDANTSGTVYLDELKANDDGGLIGPVIVYVGFATII